jgi:localization factor PodJL
MPPADEKSQPVARKKGRGQARDCGAADVRDALQQIAGQIGDADKRHCNALVRLQECLGQLGDKVDSVRADLPKHDAKALERIEDGIGALAERVARFGEARKWQKVAPGGAGSRAMPRGSDLHATAADADAPWDAEAAEALTRVCESAEAELRRPREALRPARREHTKETSPQPTQEQWPSAGPDRAWLEARLAGIAGLLQQSLDSIDPDKSLTAINGRLDRFEARFEAALATVAQRADVAGLVLLEAQLRELATEFEHTRGQLARLDTMDEALRDLARGLESQRQRSAEEATRDSRAIETMIDAAAERAAARLAEAMPATAPTDSMEAQGRVEALEGLLQDYIEERRRGEEITAGILHTIEDALVRIVDRVDAIDLAKPQPAPAQDQERAGRDGLEIESAHLAEAYAAGARALGHRSTEFALDAADYTQFVPRDKKRDVPRLDPTTTGADEAEGDAQIHRRQELQPSGVRSKLMAQAMRAEPRLAAGPGREPNAGADNATPARSSSGAGGTRFSSLLAMAMLLLFGTGYLVVDVFLTSAPPSVSQQPPARSAAERRLPADAVESNVLPGSGSGTPQPAADTKRSDFVPPADDGQGATDPPAPSKRRPHVPETVTDDLSQNEGGENRDAAKPVSLGHQLAAAVAATPIAVPAEAGIGPQDRSLAGRDNPRLLPSGIGPAALRNAAASGDPAAEFEVATRFAEGKGVPQDLKLAFAWYQRAAAQGHAAAQFRLAAFHERGVGVPADRERAAVWYRRAAEQGHVKAMHNLAVLMAGKGATAADYAAAARWFRVAAERGLADSQYNLGVLCEEGRGVGRSLAEAYKWFALAARSGDRGAAQRLEQIKARLNPVELAGVEQTVAAWRARDAEPAAASADSSAVGQDAAGD